MRLTISTQAHLARDLGERTHNRGPILQRARHLPSSYRQVQQWR
jgi:hypothetical protein